MPFQWRAEDHFIWSLLKINSQTLDRPRYFLIWADFQHIRDLEPPSLGIIIHSATNWHYVDISF